MLGGHLAAQFLSVMAFLSFECQEENRDQSSNQLRSYDGTPDSIDAPDEGEKEHCRHLKQQRAQKGDQRGGQTVVQSGKEGGAENGDAGEQEGHRVKPHASGGQRH